MNLTLTRWLARAACRGDLTLVVLEEGDPPNVEEGLLVCTRSSAYPVLAGGPRLLEGPLAAIARFLERWSSELEASGIRHGRAPLPPSGEDAKHRLVLDVGHHTV